MKRRRLEYIYYYFNKDRRAIARKTAPQPGHLFAEHLGGFALGEGCFVCVFPACRERWEAAGEDRGEPDNTYRSGGTL